MRTPEHIKKIKSLILFSFYLLVSFSYIYICLNDQLISSKGHFCIVWITTLCLLILIHICLSSRYYAIVAFGSILLLLFLSEITYFIVYGEMISEGVIDSIVETNSSELSSMLMHPVKIIIPALLATLAILFLFKKFIHIKLRLFVPISFYVLCITFVIHGINSSTVSEERKKGDYKGSALLARGIYPVVVGNLLYFYASHVSVDLYSNVNEIEKFNDAIILPPKESDNKIIIFIMGESSLSKRYSVYGYNKPTTPLIHDIFGENNKGCIIKDSHSAASFTRDSLALTLSFNVPESDNNLFENKSLIEMAKFNDYKTYWLGSQAIKGTFNTKYGFIARKSDVVKIINDGDINLSKWLEKAFQEDDSSKKFVFMHLRGSHEPYINYDDLDKQALPDADAYDLTIHHTDRVVKTIYDTVKKYSDNYTLIYTSDHGENVGSGAGHGMMRGVDQFLVPFLFLSTNSQYDCQFIESFRGPTGYLSGLMNKYIVSALLGYELDQTIVDKEKSNDRVFMADGSTRPFLNITPLTP